MPQICVDQSIGRSSCEGCASIEESEREGASADKDSLSASACRTDVLRGRATILVTLILSLSQADRAQSLSIAFG
jgi:hypothetical protein